MRHEGGVPFGRRLTTAGVRQALTRLVPRNEKKEGAPHPRRPMSGPSRPKPRWRGRPTVCLAYGFKKYRLGELIGTRTEGAVLAATAFLIGDQGLLLLAVDDVRVDGERLEGVGVAPTIEVAFDPRYAAGSDPQLERAVQILSQVKGG